jgi:hypothetical protein
MDSYLGEGLKQLPKAQEAYAKGKQDAYGELKSAAEAEKITMDMMNQRFLMPAQQEAAERELYIQSGRIRGDQPGRTLSPLAYTESSIKALEEMFKENKEMKERYDALDPVDQDEFIKKQIRAIESGAKAARAPSSVDVTDGTTLNLDLQPPPGTFQMGDKTMQGAQLVEATPLPDEAGDFAEPVGPSLYDDLSPIGPVEEAAFDTPLAELPVVRQFPYLADQLLKGGEYAGEKISDFAEGLSEKDLAIANVDPATQRQAIADPGVYAAQNPQIFTKAELDMLKAKEQGLQKYLQLGLQSQQKQAELEEKRLADIKNRLARGVETGFKEEKKAQAEAKKGKGAEKSIEETRFRAAQKDIEGLLDLYSRNDAILMSDMGVLKKIYDNYQGFSEPKIRKNFYNAYKRYIDRYEEVTGAKGVQVPRKAAPKGKPAAQKPVEQKPAKGAVSSGGAMILSKFRDVKASGANVSLQDFLAGVDQEVSRKKITAEEAKTLKDLMKKEYGQ